MSGAAMVWAAQQRVGRATDKLALLMVASDCRSDALFFGSAARLTETTGLDRKTLQGALRRLEDEGLIVDTGERTGRTRQIVVYRLPLGSSPKTGTLKPPENGHLCGSGKEPENGELDLGKEPVFPVKGAQKRATYTVIEPVSPSEIAIAREEPTRFTRLDDDWKPRLLTGDAAKLTEHWTADRHDTELSKFRDHHQAKDNKFADWNAAWRKWTSNAVSFERNHHGGNRNRAEPQNPMVRAYRDLGDA